MNIYIASPFFNDCEVEVVSNIENIIEITGNTMYSPMRSGIILKDLEPNERESASDAVFEENISMINWCDLMIANTDNFDAGTMIEVGYAFCSNKQILTYSNKGYGANVMIAKMSLGHYTNYEDLTDALESGIYNNKMESVI